MNETKPRPAQKTFRLSDKGRNALATLAEHLGVTELAVVELALRDKLKAEGLDTLRREGAEVAA